jgi:hypothetical protein
MPLASRVYDGAASCSISCAAAIMNTFGCLRNSFLKYDGHHVDIVMCSEDVVELLFRWYTHDTLRALACVKYLEGYNLVVKSLTKENKRKESQSTTSAKGIDLGS